MFRRYLNAVAAPALLFCAANSSSAQGVEAIARPCGVPCVPDGDCRPVECRRPLMPQVVRTSSRVRADLEGRVVRYEVTETYTNRGGTARPTTSCPCRRARRSKISPCPSTARW
jgi:hypothetical protein